ncbi:MAG: 1-acyl-sn-glycerol-3-phosphate acyltransferase [Gemmatimonadota bacterium]
MQTSQYIRLLALLAAAALVWLITKAWLNRSARRTLLHFRGRVDRFKLTRKAYIVRTLLADEAIVSAVQRHSRETGESMDETWARVRGYLDEIVPYFNVLAYYRLGYSASRALLGLFYKVDVGYERRDPFAGIPRDAIIIYLMNHRSNADYVLVAYALAGDVSISYAVGEWARAFPLEYIFKSFGSYFVRRKYRESLYHSVLEGYVQLITRNAVTQGIFPEGGLTRDGRLQRGKIGLLDYALGVARDPALRSRIYIVPIGINYDRVLEDRSLLRELATREKRERPSRLTQLAEVGRYLLWNTGRLLTGRWKRYGLAAVTIGTPAPIDDWFRRLAGRGIDLYSLERTERLGHVQELCDETMSRVGQIIPVPAVALTCAALQTFDADYVEHAALVARMAELRDVLVELNARPLRADRDIELVLERAWRMLRMRRIVARHGSGYAILPRGRPLIAWYANSIDHLLGDFAKGLRDRDSLPISAGLDAWR